MTEEQGKEIDKQLKSQEVNDLRYKLKSLEAYLKYKELIIRSHKIKLEKIKEICHE